MEIDHAGHDVHALGIDDAVAGHALGVTPAFGRDRIEGDHLRDRVAFHQDVVGAYGRATVTRNDHGASDHQPSVWSFGEVSEVGRLSQQGNGAEYCEAGHQGGPERETRAGSHAKLPPATGD